MKSDRLLSIVMLLQARGRLSARVMAAELDVSERTVLRDLEALSAAGVPVYAERGRRGGWALLDGYRSDLSGLTEEEAGALFMVAGAGAAELGRTPGVRSALRKLAAALAERHRRDALAAAGRVLVDRARWGTAAASAEPGALGAVQRALAAGRRLRFDYEAPGRERVERTVDPVGLVAKSGRWYLLALAAGERRTYRLERMSGAELCDAQSSIPDGFDLEQSWRQVQREFERTQEALQVRVTVTPEAAGMIERLIPRSRPRPWAGGDGRGRVGLELSFPGPAAAAGPLAGIPGVEVIEPGPVRRELRRIGLELAARYREPAARDATAS